MFIHFKPNLVSTLIFYLPRVDDNLVIETGVEMLFIYWFDEWGISIRAFGCSKYFKIQTIPEIRQNLR